MLQAQHEQLSQETVLLDDEQIPELPDNGKMGPVVPPHCLYEVGKPCTCVYIDRVMQGHVSYCNHYTGTK